MDLLVESYTADEAKMITEMHKDNKNVFLSGTFMQAETKNKNGRIYQLSEMTNAVQNAMRQIKEYGGLAGELDHPPGLTVAAQHVSHVITEMTMNGNNVSGKLKLLDTPMGLIAKELARSGLRYGVSSRGTGTVRADGIVEGFNFVTLDIVINPSANAYPTAVYESIQSKLGQKVLTLAETVQQDPEAQKHFRKQFTKFFEEIMNKK